MIQLLLLARLVNHSLQGSPSFSVIAPTVFILPFGILTETFQSFSTVIHNRKYLCVEFDTDKSWIRSKQQQVESELIRKIFATTLSSLFLNILWVKYQYLALSGDSTLINVNLNTILTRVNLGDLRKQRSQYLRRPSNERTNWYRVLLLCYCYLIGIDVAIISRISTAQGKIQIILKTHDIFRRSSSTNRDSKS